MSTSWTIRLWQKLAATVKTPFPRQLSGTSHSSTPSNLKTISGAIRERLEEIQKVYDDIHSMQDSLRELQTVDQAMAEYEMGIAEEAVRLTRLRDRRDELDD